MAIIDSVKLPDNSTYEVADNHSGYQKETLTTPITINGTQETTVEGALGGLNDYGDALADNLAANEERGAKNLIPYPYEDGASKTDNGITFTANSDGSVTASGIALANTDFNLGYKDFGNADMSSKPNDSTANGYVISTGVASDSGTTHFLQYQGNNHHIYFVIVAGADLSTPITFYPMIRDARIIDPTFAPYAETNLQLTRKTSGVSNRNLLDNSWFTVNQRGASSYSTAGNYTADRWYMPFGSLTVDISSSGATLTATADTVLEQKFETNELKGKTVTLSIKHFDGTIEQGTVQFPSTAGSSPVTITGGELQANVDTYGNCNLRIVILTGNTITARAIKLEVGSVSTLANDVAPDYTTELLKCQTSCKVWEFSTNQVVGIAFGDGAGGYIELPISVPFRTTPYGVTYSGSLGILGDPITSLQYASGGINGSNVNIYIQKPTSLSPNTPYIVQATSATKIIVSADI